MKSIKKRLLFIMTFFTFAVAILTTTYCYFSNRAILRKSLRQSTGYSLQLLAETIQNDLDNALALANFCTANGTVLSYLNASNSGQANTSSLANYAWERLQEEYLSNSSSAYINRIIVSDLHDRYLHISPSVVYQGPSCAAIIRSQPFFDELYTADDPLWIGFVPDAINTQVQSQMVLPIVRPICASYAQNAAGWCYVGVSDSIFITHLKSYSLPADSRLYLSFGDRTYQWADGALREAAPPDTRASDSYVRYSPDGGWEIAQLISRSALRQQTLVYMSSLLLILGIVLSIGMALTVYIHRSVNVPLRQLERKLQAVSEGDFAADPSIEWDNELGDIGRGLNSMGAKISALIESRMRDQEKKYELEYEVLQNQINPHFLYNTLNSIIWMASAQGAHGIEEMTSALCALLQSVSKKSAPLHTLREEIELLNHYFLIQKYRYGGGLALNCTVEDPSLESCLVLKFMLQIVVENAIFHGIAPKGASGKIDVRIRRIRDGRDVLITVTDNGIGMTPEQIRNVMEYAPSFSDPFRKIGINNIQKRLLYSYGEGYGISIESTPGSFTTVSIVFPYQQREDGQNV